jgi:hypothetical protein
LAKLQALIAGGEETPEPGFKTSDEWGKLWGKARATSQGYLHAGVKAGLMEARKYRRKVKSGHDIRPVIHWREIRGKK